MNTKTKVIGSILVIILILTGLLIIFSFLGDFSPTIKDSANKATYPNTCDQTKDAAGLPLSFNLSGLNCYNSTYNSQGAATIVALPLASSLFSVSGLLLIVLMLVILLVVFFVILHVMKR